MSTVSLGWWNTTCFCNKKMKYTHALLSMITFAAASLQILFICAVHGLFTCDDRNDIMTLTYFDESSGISKG